MRTISGNGSHSILPAGKYRLLPKICTMFSFLNLLECIRLGKNRHRKTVLVTITRCRRDRGTSLCATVSWFVWGNPTHIIWRLEYASDVSPPLSIPSIFSPVLRPFLIPRSKNFGKLCPSWQLCLTFHLHPRVCKRTLNVVLSLALSVAGLIQTLWKTMSMLSSLEIDEGSYVGEQKRKHTSSHCIASPPDWGLEYCPGRVF